MITVRAKLELGRTTKGKRTIRLVDGSNPPPSTSKPRVPRISKLVALALTFDRMLREGQVHDLSELARLARVSQPRMSQILNLSLLAPDLIETLLHLPATQKGKERVHERMLRPVVAEADWSAQRMVWAKLHHWQKCLPPTRKN